MLSHFLRVWLCDPMGCSLPGSSVHGILQARIYVPYLGAYVYLLLNHVDVWQKTTKLCKAIILKFKNKKFFKKLKKRNTEVGYHGLLQVIFLTKIKCQISSVQFSHSVMSDSLGPHESQHSRPPCPSPTPRVHSNSHPSSRWYHTQPSHPLLSPFPPAPNPSQHQSLSQWVNFSHEVAKVLEFQL